MNPWTKAQEGSPSRDRFKYLHKNLLHRKFWALNSDLELVDKHPVPFIVARLDFKVKGDSISFTEAISYNQFVNMPVPYYVPVYIVEANSDFMDVEPDEHRFDVYRYVQADWRPDPPVVEKLLAAESLTWKELGYWEGKLRLRRRKEMASLVDGTP